jgi:hypothetical protein
MAFMSLIGVTSGRFAVSSLGKSFMRIEEEGGVASRKPADLE